MPGAPYEPTATGNATPDPTTSPPLENPAATTAGDDYLDYEGKLDENEGGSRWCNLRYNNPQVPVEPHHPLHNRK